MGAPDTVDVETPAGKGRLVVYVAAEPVALLVLGHGAGGGVETFDLGALAAALPGDGVTVALYEQPWRVSGRRVAGPPASLDRAWLPALDAARALADVPLFVGGRSAGARVACRTVPPDARGLVLLSFPLHPPGRPDRSRVDELAATACDALVVQGERDPFGGPAELRAALESVAQQGHREVVGVPGTHSFEPRTRAAREAAPGLRAALCGPVRRFLRERLADAPV